MRKRGGKPPTLGAFRGIRIQLSVTFSLAHCAQDIPLRLWNHALPIWDCPAPWLSDPKRIPPSQVMTFLRECVTGGNPGARRTDKICAQEAACIMLDKQRWLKCWHSRINIDWACLDLDQRPCPRFPVILLELTCFLFTCQGDTQLKFEIIIKWAIVVNLFWVLVLIACLDWEF